MTVSECGRFYSCQSPEEHSSRGGPRVQIGLCHDQFLHRIESLIHGMFELSPLRMDEQKLRRLSVASQPTIAGHFDWSRSDKDMLNMIKLSLTAERKDILEDCIRAWKFGRDPERRILATIVALSTDGIYYTRQGCVLLGIDLQPSR
jgi:hypothetical protein